MSNRPPLKKYGLGIVLTIFSLVTMFGSVAFVQPAKAQFAVTTLTDIPRMLGDLGNKIKEGLKGAVMGAVQKSVSYFMRKVAYDSAVWLASGGKGQAPLANTSDFGDYLENVAGNALGEGLDALGQPFGLNLCKVPDVKVDLAIKIGLRFRAGEPVNSPGCDWENLKKGWGTEAWKSKYGSIDALQKQFNISLKADSDTDLGIYLQSVQKIDSIVSAQTEKATLERQEGQGFKDFTTLISGAIKTPAQLQKLQAEANHPSRQQDKSEAQINAAFASGMFNILPQTLGLFLDTLASQMVKNFKENGMFPFGVCIGEYGGDHCKTITNSVAVFEGEGARSGGRAAAQAVFNELLVANVKTLDNYNILGQLQNCPEEAPSTYNCRIDSDMVLAIQEASYSNKPVTIAEAIEKGWIHKEWKLFGPERPENLDLRCKDTAYCYGNIKVLRQVRLLPLGFEIAALNSPPDNPWTIGQVIGDPLDNYAGGFNNCNPNGSYDPVNYPFCHLIDPNWVLKLEPTRCNAYVYGARLMMSDAPDRLEDCVDLSSCIAYNNDGTCSSYGYCTREKNVWRFDADKCDAQYSTCKAFKDSTGKDVAYLYRTLDTSYCSEGTAGCAAFSLNQNSNGNWLDPGVNLASQYFNNGIHFNNKISTSCGSNSAGCSAFKIATTKDVLYLRKAPDYLNCYDADLAVNGIQWPQNNADLSKMEPKADCSLYSGVCTAQEVDCNLFTSLLTAEEIPGKFKVAEISGGQVTWNDQCDAKCNGYAAYREMPNNYSNGRNVAYIIPSSGNTCAAVDEGCSSFTNMGEVSAGGEKVEYYSYLRPCIKPDTNKQKNFYTYEGNKAGGYQLKSYTLEKTADGSPKYWYKVAGDLADYDNKCNEASYKAGLSDPDCRQFNDESGNVYYALLSKTIVVNNSCTYYRLNSPELAGGNTCFQNGEYKDGFCYYYGLPQGVTTTGGSSRSCSASAESCFAYKGNTANNVKEIFKDSFENINQTISSLGWSGGVYSTESTHYGEHSLGYSGSASLVKSLNNVTVGRTYVLTFWAKGTASNIAVSLSAGVNSTVGNFNTSDVWQYYSFSPVELSGNTSTVSLVFSGINSKDVFLDNIRLVEVTDYLYLVRNSLKVDPVCDSNLNDNLPGESLGCTGYSVKGAVDTYYLTNFSYLCRTSAVGCTAVLDTYNTLENEKPDAYNIWINGTAGTRSITMADGKSFSCVVLTGDSGCYTNISGYTKSQIETAGGVFNASTVYVPGDTPANAPIYLVATAADACNAIDLGCTFAGAKSTTASGVKYNTVTVKNDPAEYNKNLCQSQAVGCNAYAYSNGTYYFKDPAIMGQKVCSYSENVVVNGVNSSGWFWKNVGSCSNNANLNCSSDADCGTGNTCRNIGKLPCYPDYKKTDNDYGLWSFGDVGKYENFAGECPATQSGCTEFVDNNDKDKNGNGRPYYLINNNKITAGDCDGLVSQKLGCVLFDQTDKPAKLYNTVASYKLSDDNQAKLVEPVKTGEKDANIIIKVARDRECGEWLECASSHRTWDEKESKFKELCDWIGRCTKGDNYSLDKDTTTCSDPLVKNNYEYTGQLFGPSLYAMRDTSWKGMDFTGYSMLGVYPIEELSQVDIDEKTDVADWRLVKTIYCRRNDVNGNCGGSSSDTSCIEEDKSCGTPKVGICKNSVCIQDPTGGTDFNDKYMGVSAPQCRAYPERTSPFPNTYKAAQSRNFLGANWCNEIASPADDTSQTPNAFSCECEYTKVSYGDYKTLYFNYYKPNQGESIKDVKKKVVNNVPSYLCQGGINEGKVCITDEDCGDKGSCQQKTKEDSILGWRGYCLEKDVSRNLFADNTRGNCLTWLPVDTLMGLPDINNQRTEAGFQFVEGNGGKYYCLLGTETGSTTDALYTGDYTQNVSEKNCIQLDDPEDNTSLLAKCAKEEQSASGKCSELKPVTGKDLVGKECKINTDCGDIMCVDDGEGGGVCNIPLGYGCNKDEDCGDYGLKCDGHCIDPYQLVTCVKDEDCGNFRTCVINNAAKKYTCNFYDSGTDQNVSGVLGSCSAFKQYTPYSYDGLDVKLFLINREDSKNRYSTLPLKVKNKNIHIDSIDYISLGAVYGDNSGWLDANNWLVNKDEKKQKIVVRNKAMTTYTKDKIEIKFDDINDPVEFKDVTTPEENAGLYAKNGEQLLQNVAGDETVVYVTDGRRSLIDNGNGSWYIYYYKGPADLKSYFVPGYNGNVLPQYNLFATNSVNFAPDNSSVVLETSAVPAAPVEGNIGDPYVRIYSADAAGCKPNTSIGKDGCLLPYAKGLFACAVKMNFKDFYLDSAQMVCYEGDNYSNAHTNFYNLDVVTNEICTHVALTGENVKDAVAHTNNIWEFNKTPLEIRIDLLNGGNMMLNYSTFLIPFGSFNINDLNSTKYLNRGKSKDNDVVYDNDRLVEAKNHLSNIFPKFSVFKSSDGPYILDKNESVNNTGKADSSFAPQIHPLGKCDSSGKCVELDTSGLTVNGGTKDVNTGDVLLNNENGFYAILKFYAFADADHMPIKRVRIDWGDGMTPYDSSPNSFFRNQRGAIMTTNNSGQEVLADQCFEGSGANEFGHILNKTCNNGYFRFTHSYSCTRDDVDHGWDPNCGGNVAMKNENNGCCVYKPRVQVKDNWGWCNGDDGSGYYDGNDDSIDDQCGYALDSLKLPAYTQFRGQILVAPQD